MALLRREALILVAAPAAAAQLALPWPDSTTDTHLFLTMDAAYNETTKKAQAKRFDFVWGGSDPGAYHSGSDAIVISGYTPYAYDCGWGGNLTWWQQHHPEKILYQCDKKTPAWWQPSRTDCVPFDIQNEQAVDLQFAAVVEKAETGFRDQGFDALAADMFYLENDFKACGVWKTNKTDGNSSSYWHQYYSGAAIDDSYAAAHISWARAVSKRLTDPKKKKHMRLVPNYSLFGRRFDDKWLNELLAVPHIGILDEQGYSNFGSMMQGGAWVNLLKHQLNVQAHGAGYYQINQLQPKSLFNVTNPAARRFLVGSYLLGKANASAVFLSATQDYGELFPHWPEFQARLGHAVTDALPLQPILGDIKIVGDNLGNASTSVVFAREFSMGVVAVNANEAGCNRTFVLKLDQSEWKYQDVYGKAVNSTEVGVPRLDAVILVRVRRSEDKSNAHAIFT